MTKKYQDDYALLLGLLFIAAVFFFHWRENKQEDWMRKATEVIDFESDDVNKMGLKQRIKKLEDTLMQAEVKPLPPPKTKPVKAKPKVKKVSQDFANGSVDTRIPSNIEMPK